MTDVGLVRVVVWGFVSNKSATQGDYLINCRKQSMEVKELSFFTLLQPRKPAYSALFSV